MDADLTNQRLEELVEISDEIDREVKILSHAKTSVYESISNTIMDEYASEIRDRVDEVFAIGTEVLHDPESATCKTVIINIEPASTFEDFEKELECEHQVREEIYDKFPDIRKLRKVINISFDCFHDNVST